LPSTFVSIYIKGIRFERLDLKTEFCGFTEKKYRVEYDYSARRCIIVRRIVRDFADCCYRDNMYPILCDPEGFSESR